MRRVTDAAPQELAGGKLRLDHPAPHVARLTIDHPAKRNALDHEILDAIAAVVPELDCRCLLVTAAGPVFSAGYDIGGLPRDEFAHQAEALVAHPFHDAIAALDSFAFPSVAALNGHAIGGGHVLHVLCDLTVAAEHASFGQTGPRVGSFDAGFGSAYLARVVGEKRARQLWFLLDRIDAAKAEQWGLVNAVVPADQLLPTALAWGRRMAGYSPTALRFLKHSFNADSDSIAGLSHLAFDGLELFAHSEEGMEGARAFAERRPPDFGPYR